MRFIATSEARLHVGARFQFAPASDRDQYPAPPARRRRRPTAKVEAHGEIQTHERKRQTAKEKTKKPARAEVDEDVIIRGGFR